MNLSDKSVVITGGTKGLGKALATSFLKEGAKILVCSRDDIKPADLEENIFWQMADVTKESDLENLAKTAVEKFGHLDIWINNAGVWLPHAFVEDFDMEKVKEMFNVNVFGTMNGSRVALRLIKKQNFGCIVNIISDSGFVARPMSSMYSASKWAVTGFTKSIREANRNIKIISVYPGGMKTDIFGDSKPEAYKDFMDSNYVASEIIENFKKEEIKEELIIQS